MSQFFEFVAAYETAVLLGEPYKIILDPLKIELLPMLPRVYSVGVQGPHTFASGEPGFAMQEGKIQLDPPKRYVVLTARTSEQDPVLARKNCEEEVDRGVTLLAVQLHPGVLGQQVYRGWVESAAGFMLGSWVRLVPPIRVTPSILPEPLGLIRERIEHDSDLWHRFTLMSRFYTKALALLPSEEKFLYLWTILEIWPMKDTSDIRPISAVISEIVGMSATEVKTRLGVGRLFGLRSNLVHNGSIGVDSPDLGDVIVLLENMCGEIIRRIAGLPYGGTLDYRLHGEDT